MRMKFMYNSIVISFLMLTACSSYKSNIMFISETSSVNEDWFRARPFEIESGDELSFAISLWNGEDQITPRNEESEMANPFTIAINQNGIGKFPVIGTKKLKGLNLSQADSVLTKAYSKYFKDPFIQLRFLNKKVSVIGAASTQVLALENESVRISQIIALSGGINNQARSGNIRILRGDKVFVADLSRASSRMQNDIVLRPGDVIYVEPVRRPFGESLKDAGPAVSVLSGLITLAVVILTIF